jgi:hypothetical protein
LLQQLLALRGAATASPAAEPAAADRVTAKLFAGTVEGWDQILADLPQSDRRLLGEQAIQQRCLERQQAGARGCGTAKVGQQPVLVVIGDLLDPQEPPLGKINERRANVAEDYPAD